MMTRTCWALALTLALASCSGADGGVSDSELSQKLEALKIENRHLKKQLGALSNQAFDRASKAEAKRNLKGKSRVLRSAVGSLRFDALVMGPLKFKKKAGTFYLNIGQGSARGGLEDHPSSLSTKRGAAAPATSRPNHVKKPGPKKKTRKSDSKIKKKIKKKSGKHNVIIHKKGGN